MLFLLAIFVIGFNALYASYRYICYDTIFPGKGGE
jgi:hypothetical protein